MASNKPCILVVEDDHHLREAVADTIELAGYRCAQAESAEAALAWMTKHNADMVVSDVNMGGMDGHALLAQIKKRWPQMPVLLVTAYATIDASIDAIKNGAVDYLVKPFPPKELVSIIGRFVDHQVGDDDEPVAVDPYSQQLFQLAERVAQSDSTVLISGESGTGKEVLARFIHRKSKRARQPFVAINCAAIPENMLEATLFGHEKGAYTGAYSSAPGKFEQANGGTLLLDEISEMDLSLQAKLLRVIQEREVERLGGRKTIELDVRIIATTNRQLMNEVQAHRFREDLYYRLSVFPLHWRALRERPADIVPLAKRLLQQHAAKMRHGAVGFDVRAEAALRQHTWPGNVRELDNVIQRALIMQMGATISEADLRIDPFADGQAQAVLHNVMPAMADSARHMASLQRDMASAEIPAMPDLAEGALGDEVKQREFEIILAALKRENGCRKVVAEQLGISPRTLRYKLARMRDNGIEVDAIVNA
ncbi:MAG TPA: sigma-54 dependent transcriptional regulator [Pseudomonadales bacterium]|nr:sigma-54 dependent transcriptional regulator [Pseudomonadales bacterium]